MLDTAFFASPSELLGEKQHAWFEAQLRAPPSLWRVIASPKTFMPMTLNKVGLALALPFALVALVFLLWLACCRGVMRICPRKTQRSTDEPDQKPSFVATLPHACARCCFRCACVVFWLWAVCAPTVCILLTLQFNSDSGLVLLDESQGNWEGHPASRALLFQQLHETGRDSNNIWVVGDMHYSYLADVFRFDPTVQDLLSYTPQSEVDRYGVEFMPGSGSRGNMDEKAGEVLGSLFQPGAALTGFLTHLIDSVLQSSNPHLRHFEGSQHGYGVLRIAGQQVQASWIRCEILQVDGECSEVSGMYVQQNDNRWSFKASFP